QSRARDPLAHLALEQGDARRARHRPPRRRRCGRFRRGPVGPGRMRAFALRHGEGGIVSGLAVTTQKLAVPGIPEVARPALGVVAGRGGPRLNVVMIVAPRFVACAALALVAAGCMTSTFVLTDARYAGRAPTSPEVYVDRLPPFRYISIGVIEVSS